MRLFHALRATLSIPRGRGGLLLLALLSVTFAAGCSDGGTTDPGGSFSLALSSGVLTITQGSNGAVTVTIERSGDFAGAVTITVTGLPTGVTAGALTIGAGSTSGQLTLTATGAATVGNASLTVRGTGSGVGDDTAPLALTVTVPGGGGGGNVTMEFCGAAGGLPIWVAFQDGVGAWTQASGAGPTYSSQINANTGAVAWVTQDVSGGFVLNVSYATRAELIVTGEERCLEPGAGKTVTGTVAGLSSPFQLANFTLGRATISGAAPNFAAPGVTFSGVPNGSVDLIGGFANFDLGTGAVTPTRMYVQRSLNPAPGSSVGTIDLFGASSFLPEQRNLTINGVGGSDDVLQTNILFTAQGNGLIATATGQNSWYAVPGARLVGSDIQLLAVLATSIAGGGLAPQRAVQRVLAAPTDLNLTLGPDLSAPTVTSIPATGYVRGRTTYPIQPQYQRYWIATFVQAPQPGHTSRSTQIQMTSGYRASTTGEAILDTPDFAGVTGWTPLWGLRTGTLVTWTLNAIGWNSAGGIFQPVLTAGETFLSATRLGQFTP